MGYGRGIGRALSGALLIAGALALASCGGGTRQAEKNPQVYKLGDRVPEGGGRYKVGKPYQIKGRWYRPKEDRTYSAQGIASWYGEYFHGRKTANGEWYDMERLSAAHPTLPLPTYVRVTNLENGKTIVVRVNDRGPYAHNREIDMSWAAAKKLGFVRNGTAKVHVKYIGDAPIEGDVPNMQYVDGGPNMQRPGGPNRPFFTASTKSGTKAGTRSKANGERKRSPLAAQILSDAPLPVRKPATGSLQVRRAPPRVAPPNAAQLPRRAAPKNVSAVQSATNRPQRIAPRGYYVQAASFRNETYARSFREDLTALGVSEILPVPFGEGTLYQVRLGPFGELQDALDAQHRLAGRGHRDARVVRK